MVDERSARFRGVLPMPVPTPPPPPRPKNTTQSFLDNWGRDFVRKEELVADEQSRGLGTNTLDAMVRRGAADTGLGRAAAFAGDILLDPLGLSGIGAAALGGRAVADVLTNPVVRQTLGGVHRGPANMQVINPRDVPEVSGRAIGPGFYATPQATEQANIGQSIWGGDKLPGDRSNLYRMSGSLSNLAKLARSKGYATYDDMQRAIREVSPGANYREMTVDNPVIRKLQQEGFVGYAPTGFGPSSPEFTNWLVGARDIGRVNSELPVLGVRDITRLTAMQEALGNMGVRASGAVREAVRPLQNASRSVVDAVRGGVGKIKSAQESRAAADAARKAAEEAAKRKQNLLPPAPPR
jgi:hypothetical protein